MMSSTLHRAVPPQKNTVLYRLLMYNPRVGSALSCTPCIMLNSPLPYHNTYSESSLSRRVLMVSAHVASSVCMRCEIVWYVFEFSLSSITPCNSKSEYSFWKIYHIISYHIIYLFTFRRSLQIFWNRTAVFELGSNYVQFSTYQTLITIMGILSSTVMTHLVLMCSELSNTKHLACFTVSQQKGSHTTLQNYFHLVHWHPCKNCFILQSSDRFKFENSSLFGCDPVTLGEWFLTFLCNNGDHSPNNTASHSRRPEPLTGRKITTLCYTLGFDYHGCFSEVQCRQCLFIKVCITGIGDISSPKFATITSYQIRRKLCHNLQRLKILWWWNNGQDGWGMRYRQKRNGYKISVGNPEGKIPFWTAMYKWEENIKTDLKEVRRVSMCGLESSCLIQKIMAGLCECGNELLNSMKGGKFLCQLRTLTRKGCALRWQSTSLNSYNDRQQIINK